MKSIGSDRGTWDCTIMCALIFFTFELLYKLYPLCVEGQKLIRCRFYVHVNRFQTSQLFLVILQASIIQGFTSPQKLSWNLSVAAKCVYGSTCKTFRKLNPPFCTQQIGWIKHCQLQYSKRKMTVVLPMINILPPLEKCLSWLFTMSGPFTSYEIFTL